jgi:hypothetical protein
LSKKPTGDRRQKDRILKKSFKRFHSYRHGLLHHPPGQGLLSMGNLLRKLPPEFCPGSSAYGRARGLKRGKTPGLGTEGRTDAAVTRLSALRTAGVCARRKLLTGKSGTEAGFPRGFRLQDGAKFEAGQNSWAWYGGPHGCGCIQAVRSADRWSLRSAQTPNGEIRHGSRISPTPR